MDSPATPSAPTLTDGVVTVRAHRPADAAGSYEQCQDPASQRWTSAPVPYSMADAEQFVGEVMPGGWADGTSWGFAVEHEGAYAGTIELRPDPDTAAGVAEVAYGAHPGARGVEVDGRSVMERALRLVLGWGFDAAGLHTVLWRAHRGNWASRRLAWKVGFRVEGTVRQWVTQRGTRHDAWVGTLLREDPREPSTTWLRPPDLHGADPDGRALRLRPLTEADVPRIVEACADERTQRWLGRLPSPYDEAQARAYLLSVGEGHAEGRRIVWGVADAASDLLLASMSLFDLEPGAECEIGYWAHPDARGLGVVTEAAGLALRYAFGALRMQRVVGFVATGNTASRGVLEANGLRSYGVERLGARVRGGRADQLCLDVLAEEWLAGQAARIRASVAQA